MRRHGKRLLAALVIVAFPSCYIGDRVSFVDDAGVSDTDTDNDTDTDTDTDSDNDTDTDTDTDSDTDIDTDTVADTDTNPPDAPDGWEWIAPPGGASVVGLWVSPSGAAYCTVRHGADGNGIARFDGSAWNYIESPVMEPSMYDDFRLIWGRGDDDIYVEEYISNTILHFNGESWTTVRARSWFSDVWVAEDGTAYVIGARVVMRYADGAWTDITDPQMGELTAVWGCAPNDVIALGYDEDSTAMFRWNGEAWTKTEAEVPTYLAQMWGASCEDLYAADGGLWHFDGSSWSEETVWEGDDYNVPSIVDVGGTSATNVYAVGSVEVTEPYWGEDTDGEDTVYTEGLVVRWDGTTWTRIDPDVQPLAAIWGFSTGEIVLLEENGLPKFFDGSAVEALLAPETPNYCNGVWGNASNDFYIFGSEGQIQHFDGMAWTIVDSGTTTSHLYNMSGDATGLIMATSYEPNIVMTEGTGMWELIDPTGDPCDNAGIATLGGDAEHVYGIILGGTRFSRFDGVTWECMDVPVFDENDYLVDLWLDVTGSPFVAANRWDVDTSSYLYGKMARYQEGAWELLELPAIDSESWALTDITGFDTGEIVAVGYQEESDWFETITSIALHYQDGVWSAIELAGSDDLLSVWGSSASDVYAAGYESGSLAHFEGTSWSEQTFDGWRLGDIDGSGANNVYMIGYAVSGGDWVGYLLHKSEP